MTDKIEKEFFDAEIQTQEESQEELKKTKGTSEAAEEFKKKNYKYTAFISYRHVEPDMSVAEKIHGLIETFKVPKEFYVDGVAPKFRVFRDREELTTTYLSDSLQQALEDSKFLIVICSKRYPLSEWCLREVEIFKELHGADRIIPVLLEGEPFESFPPMLQNLRETVIDEKGNAHETSKELLAAELRPAEVLDPDFIGYEALERQNDPRLKTLTKKTLDMIKVEKYRIMAAILGVSFGDLKNRDKQRRQQQIMRFSIAGMIALIFFGAFMINAYTQERIAKREAIQNNSAMLLSTSSRYLDEGDRVMSLIVSEKAMEPLDEEMSLYEDLVTRHKRLLNDAVFNSSAKVRTVIDTDNHYTFLGLSKDETKFAAGLGNSEIGVWDARNGERIQTLKGHTRQVKVIEYSKNGEWIASGSFDDTVKIWDATTYELIHTIDTGHNIMYASFSFDDKYLLILNMLVDGYELRTFSTDTWTEFHEPIKTTSFMHRISQSKNDYTAILSEDALKDQTITIINYETGEIVKTLDNPKKQDINPITGEMQDYPMAYSEALFASNNKEIFARNSQGIFRLDIETGKVIYSIEFGTNFEKNTMALSEDGKTLFVADSISIKAFDAETGKLLRETSLPDSVKDYEVKGQRIVVIYDKGGMGLIDGDVLVDEKIFYGSGSPEYVWVTRDGTRAITCSLTDQTIKIIDLVSNDNSANLDGLILGISSNAKWSLISQGDDVCYIRNNETGDIEPCSGEILEWIGWNTFSKPNIALSNDGSLLAYLREIDTDGDQYADSKVLEIAEAKTGEVLFNMEADLPKVNLQFSHDSKKLLMEGDSKVTYIDIQNKKELDNMDVDVGLIRSIVLSQDDKYGAFTSLEGNSLLYDLTTKEILGDIPGKVLYIGTDEQGLFSKGVYNNSGVIWRPEQEVLYVHFDEKRVAKGTTQDDVDWYNPASDLLLSIQNLDGEKNATLTDFSSGELVKVFQTQMEDYPMQGFINEKGTEVAMDYSVQHIIVPEESEKIYKQVLSSKIYPLSSYEDLIKASETIIDGRELTMEEKKDIGLALE